MKWECTDPRIGLGHRLAHKFRVRLDTKCLLRHHLKTKSACRSRRRAQIADTFSSATTAGDAASCTYPQGLASLVRASSRRASTCDYIVNINTSSQAAEVKQAPTRTTITLGFLRQTCDLASKSYAPLASKITTVVGGNRAIQRYVRALVPHDAFLI